MASTAREWWSHRRQGMVKTECGACSTHFMVPSVKEVALATADSVLHSNDRKQSINSEAEARLARARECTDVGRPDRRADQEGSNAVSLLCKDAIIAGVRAGVEAAAYAALASSIATFAGVRFIPWVKSNLNYTARALIISAATVGTYFIVTEKTILACSRNASYARLEKERASAEST